MTRKPPNVLLIHTDQQRTDTLSCYGSSFTDTPNIDRLAHEGMAFDRAYCSNPVCTPSRMSLLTGLSVSRHGAWNVGVNVPDGSVTTIAHRLGAAGYRSHMIGKAHLQSFNLRWVDEPLEDNPSVENLRSWRSLYPEWTGPYHGFETVELALGHSTFGIAGHYGAWVLEQVGEEDLRRFALGWSPPNEDPERAWFGGSGLDWDLPTRLHNSVWTANRTIAFLERHDRSQPFLLSVGFQDPHHPHAVPRDWDDRVDPASVPPPDWTEGELDDKPPHFLSRRSGTMGRGGLVGEFERAIPGSSGRGYLDVTEGEERCGRAYYYTMVKIIDRELGRILAALDRLQLAEDTLVIFTTDHGELLGDHGLWFKGPFHYEQLVRVPLIIRWPAGFAGGRRSSSLASLVDIVPTCLAAAGLPVPSELDGVNVLPLLDDELASVRDHALVEYIDRPLRAKTVVTDTRKLTWYAGGGIGELYDLEEDPREKVNQWFAPEYADDKARLLSLLLDHMDTLEADSRLQRICPA